MNERCIESEFEDMLNELLHNDCLSDVSNKLDLNSEGDQIKSTNDTVDASFTSGSEASDDETEEALPVEVQEEVVVVVPNLNRPVDFNQRRRNFVMNALAMARVPMPQPPVPEPNTQEIYYREEVYYGYCEKDDKDSQNSDDCGESTKTTTSTTNCTNNNNNSCNKRVCFAVEQDFNTVETLFKCD
jgi:hypothetical protein